MILFAENGEEVIEILTRFSSGELPCLIVLDLNMPKMNGTETLRYLKSEERFRKIPVIIYSTSINPVERDRCLHLGARDYISKPASFGESVSTAKMFYQYCVDSATVPEA